MILMRGLAQEIVRQFGNKVVMGLHLDGFFDYFEHKLKSQPIEARLEVFTLFHKKAILLLLRSLD